jgi:two-component system CheB/CheR fusion protein
MVNLLANATKFTRNGGHIWVSLEHELAHGGVAAHVVLRVRDNGVGIDRELLPRIFDLFVQADRFSDRSRTGIGLGLTLARRLVELHGGTIEALSAGNSLGSEFVVRLALLPDKEIPKEAPPAPTRRARGPVAKRRVLVVDDNVDTGESTRLILELMGHEARVVSEGAAAQGELAQFKPHLVLLDIGLPDVDGYTVAKRMRSVPAGKDVRIVAVTGYGHEDGMRRSKDAGIDAHLTKPLDPELLSEILAGDD